MESSSPRIGEGKGSESSADNASLLFVRKVPKREARAGLFQEMLERDFGLRVGLLLKAEGNKVIEGVNVMHGRSAVMVTMANPSHAKRILDLTDSKQEIMLTCWKRKVRVYAGKKRLNQPNKTDRDLIDIEVARTVDKMIRHRG